MQQLIVKPSLYYFDTCQQFAENFNIGEGDLVLTNRYIYEPFFSSLGLNCQVIYQEEFGTGEPSDQMAEDIYHAINGTPKRIIGIGGGTILDLAKLFCLKYVTPIDDLFDQQLPVQKNKELLLLPTTCGTGSEVTNISILSLQRRATKKGLANDALYADYAILIPELLSHLPFSVFAASSIDAFIHAVESSLSPKANPFTKLFGYRAMEMILHGYRQLAKTGDRTIPPALLKDFLYASTYAGIAFSNAGCAAVHALSYPLGAAYHVPHGESNYAVFFGVLNKYMELDQTGGIAAFNQFLADNLNCSVTYVYQELEKLMNGILPPKSLHEYGMTQEEINLFADSVLENQQRLLANNYIPLSREQIIDIYREVF